MAKQKLTKKQLEDRLKAAEAREERELAKKAAAEKSKRIVTIVVCVVLVLALGLPTVALSVLGMGA